MKKIGIINCLEVSKRCSGAGCFKAFNGKTGSFEKQDEEQLEMATFIQCNGCSENAVGDIVMKGKEMKKLGVETIHLSTCIRAKCSYYDEFIKELSMDFQVVGYTHGSKK